jgi:dipeptidyl aminopeptidase/acylaminoacyl peptidase
MFMAGYEDEAKFDDFMKMFDLRLVADKVKAPYLIVAGAEDALSPIQYTFELFQRINAPKKLMVYEGAGHGIRDGSAAANGEEKTTVIADWMLARLQGKPFESESVWIDSSGRAKVEPFS